MTNKETAQIVRKMFRLSTSGKKATLGNKKAALKVMEEMTAENNALKALGYMTTDSGKLVKYRKVKRTEIELAIRAAAGDAKAAEAILRQFSR